MKRGFIRCVWGIYDNSHRITARRQKIDSDIQRIKTCKFNEPFRVFVYGEDNFNRIQKEGFDCVMVDKSPNPFDLIKHQYRHKIELIRYAMEVENYDELVYMDWDCVPQKKLSSNFWEECKKKAEIQACFQIYFRKKCGWRTVDQRKVPNGGYIYLRDKTIPSKVVKIWETMPQDNDEPAWAKYIDNSMGGWTNTELNMQKYWDNFEPMFCNLYRGSCFYPEKTTTKDVCFIHFL
jgi:hypothetical protein